MPSAGEIYPSMSLEERQKVLRAFHPDYIEETMRSHPGWFQYRHAYTARTGRCPGRTPSHQRRLRSEPARTGNRCADHRWRWGRRQRSTDGTGKRGQSDLVITKLRFGDANTMMAQGGIQAADREEDSPAIHYLDVIGGGHFTNYPELVEALVLDAPLVIDWLEKLGVMFDKLPDGTMMQEHGGGTSRKRMHSARDYSGAEIMRTLRDEVYNRPGIDLIEFCAAVEVVLDDKGQAAGAVLINLETEHLFYAKAKAVILATGGSGRLHYQQFPTTNHYGATGDGLVMAYRAGAKLAFLDTMQYHPTGAAFPEQILGQLVTEKVRGLGAQPVNIDGKQFVYPLEPRDVEAAAFIRECVEHQKGVFTANGQPCVWLDTPLIDIIHGPGTIEKSLPAMVRQYRRFNIDMVSCPSWSIPRCITRMAASI